MGWGMPSPPGRTPRPARDQSSGAPVAARWRRGGDGTGGWRGRVAPERVEIEPRGGRASHPCDWEARHVEVSAGDRPHRRNGRPTTTTAMCVSTWFLRPGPAPHVVHELGRTRIQVASSASTHFVPSGASVCPTARPLSGVDVTISHAGCKRVAERLERDGDPPRRSVSWSAGRVPTYARLVELAVLGHLEMTGPLGPVRIRGSKERVLVAMLAVRASEVVSTNELVDALWPDEPPV